MGIRIKKENGQISIVLSMNCSRYKISNEGISCIGERLYQKCGNCSLQNPVEIEEHFKSHLLNASNC